MRVKYILGLSIAIFSTISACAIYINSTGFENDETKIGFVKDYLIETKSEAWLQSRINEGKQNYKNKLQQDRETRSRKFEQHETVLQKCRAGNEAYRMKNSYQCDHAWRNLGGKGRFNPILQIERPQQTILYNKEEQQEMVDAAILRDCVSAKTIKQARKIGCFYPK